MNTQRTGLLVLLALCLLSLVAIAAHADDSNLLQDGGMEGSYSGRGRGDFTAPDAWQLWYADSPRTEVWMNLQPVSFPHNGPDPDPHSGKHALNINKGYGTFTIAVYQRVSVAKGTKVHGSAYAWLHACKLNSGSKCSGNSDSGAYVKIGIDPSGNTNPQDGGIIWSPNSQPNDTWGQISVDATATGDAVTLFLWASQNSPSDLNKVYFDDAELIAGGPGGSGPNAKPTVPPYVPFVTPQKTQSDGSIVHTVAPGDTIASIAVAYGVKGQEILDLNHIDNPKLIQIGQKLLIKPAPEPTEEATTESTATQEATGEPIGSPTPTPTAQG